MVIIIIIITSTSTTTIKDNFWAAIYSYRVFLHHQFLQQLYKLLIYRWKSTCSKKYRVFLEIAYATFTQAKKDLNLSLLTPNLKRFLLSHSASISDIFPDCSLASGTKQGGTLLSPI